MELSNIIQQFVVDETYRYTAIDNGLINHTYEVKGEEEDQRYILQKINTKVFPFPDNINDNHVLINSILADKKYSRQIVHLIPTLDGKLGYIDEEGEYWRMLTFVEDSVTYLKVPEPQIAFEAAQCISEFHSILNAEKGIILKDTLPGFINFKKRVDDYKIALDNASEERKSKSSEEIELVNKLLSLPELWISLSENHQLPERIIHADPKISNILFNHHGKAIAVIDLDTMMNATLLYDFGDMMRSYCNITNEDDASLKENFNPEIYTAVKNGFLSHLKAILTPTELENLDYAAQVVIYIQAVRFLTDYLNNDIYYSTKYEEHNLDRTKNQLNLLQNLMHFLHQKI